MKRRSPNETGPPAKAGSPTISDANRGREPSPANPRTAQRPDETEVPGAASRPVVTGSLTAAG